MTTTAKARREAESRVPMDFRNATKQPWECSSYAEFLASLPEEEQTASDEARFYAAEEMS